MHSLPTYILSECVLVYMDPVDSAAVVRWLGSTFSCAAMAVYEQVRDSGAWIGKAPCVHLGFLMGARNLYVADQSRCCSRDGRRQWPRSGTCQPAAIVGYKAATIGYKAAIIGYKTRHHSACNECLAKLPAPSPHTDQA